VESPSNKPEIIDLSIQNIKENFSNHRFEQILKSNGESGDNLLQLAGWTSKDIQTHQLLKKIFGDLYKTKDEFLEFIKNLSMKLIMEAITSSMYSHQKCKVMQNEYVEFHEHLWTIKRKYFTSQEILDMIEHPDEYGNNLLFYAAENNTTEILEMTWKEIKNIFDSTEKIQQHLRCVNNDNKNIIHNLKLKVEIQEKLIRFSKN